MQAYMNLKNCAKLSQEPHAISSVLAITTYSKPHTLFQRCHKLGLVQQARNKLRLSQDKLKFLGQVRRHKIKTNNKELKVRGQFSYSTFREFFHGCGISNFTIGLTFRGLGCAHVYRPGCVEYSKCTKSKSSNSQSRNRFYFYRL